MNYRESYHLFAVSGILFNHESPRRAELILGAEGERQAALQILSADLQERCLPSLATRAGQVAIESQLDGIDVLILDSVSTLCAHPEHSENEAESWEPIQERSRKGIRSISGWLLTRTVGAN